MTGREETVDDKEILELFAESPDPFLSTTEVANELGFSNPGINKRLHNLRDKELLNRKLAGRTNTWWLTDEGEAFLDGDAE